MTEYEGRPVRWVLTPKGKPTYDNLAVCVDIVDEGGGEYVEVRNVANDSAIAIDPQEWEQLRSLIDYAIGQCRNA